MNLFEFNNRDTLTLTQPDFDLCLLLQCQYDQAGIQEWFQVRLPGVSSRGVVATGPHSAE